MGGSGEMTAIWLLVFLFGTAAGSFLNLCALRIPQKEPFILGRSLCPRCKHLLGARDLIPLFSFIRLRGRCRYCHGRISLRYPLVELVSGFLCVAVVWVHGFSFLAVVNLVLIGILLTAALIDLEWLYVPNRLVLFGFICGTILSFRFGIPLGVPVFGAFMGTVPMLAIYLISRGGMGAGDVKLSGMIGVFLGWRLTVLALFLSFLSGAVIGLGLVIIRKKGRKDAIPFVPFLAFGAVVASLWGGNIINWYLTFSGLK
jgi:leader peptidase (prepilin peptidase)/N-methyltransferase